MPPLVLIHGIGGSADDWEFQIPFFSRHTRVIAPDLPGCGRSQKTGDYSIPAIAKDVWATLDRLEVTEINLVGHSLGGAVALQMAVDSPSRIQHLVLADTLASFEIDSVRKLTLYWYRLLAIKLFGPAWLARTVSSQLFPRAEQAAIRQRVADRSALTDREVYFRTIRSVRGWSVMGRLDHLSMPALVLAADEDYFPVLDAEKLAKALPNARLEVFRNAHHHLPLECADRFNQAVLAFIRDEDEPEQYGIRRIKANETLSAKNDQRTNI